MNAFVLKRIPYEDEIVWWDQDDKAYARFPTSRIDPDIAYHAECAWLECLAFSDVHPLIDDYLWIGYKSASQREDTIHVTLLTWLEEERGRMGHDFTAAIAALAERS